MSKYQDALKALLRLQRGHNHYNGNPSARSLDRLDFETIREALTLAEQLENGQRGEGDAIAYLQNSQAVIDELVDALRKISAYDLYDCSAVEDVNFHDQAKLMYEIAEQALQRAKEFSDGK